MIRQRCCEDPRGCYAPGVLVLVAALSVTAVPAVAQNERRNFAGGLFGMSSLSADARSVTDGSSAATSLYEPANGVSLNVFAGVHLAQYFSVQADWIWNQNDLTLTSSFLTPQRGGFYEQRRHSHQ